MRLTLGLSEEIKMRLKTRKEGKNVWPSANTL